MRSLRTSGDDQESVPQPLDEDYEWGQWRLSDNGADSPWNLLGAGARAALACTPCVATRHQLR